MCFMHPILEDNLKLWLSAIRKAGWTVTFTESYDGKSVVARQERDGEIRLTRYTVTTGTSGLGVEIHELDDDFSGRAVRPTGD